MKYEQLNWLKSAYPPGSGWGRISGPAMPPSWCADHGW
jgi:hypothetical protein